jgi:hypothetical protein
MDNWSPGEATDMVCVDWAPDSDCWALHSIVCLFLLYSAVTVRAGMSRVGQFGVESVGGGELTVIVSDGIR